MGVRDVRKFSKKGSSGRKGASGNTIRTPERGRGIDRLTVNDGRGIRGIWNRRCLGSRSRS
jgi:hypothetical protein